MNHDPMHPTPSGTLSDPPSTTADAAVPHDALAQAGDLALRSLTSREFASAMPEADLRPSTPGSLVAISGEYRRRVRDEGVVRADRWLAGALGLGMSGFLPSVPSGPVRRNPGA